MPFKGTLGNTLATLDASLLLGARKTLKKATLTKDNLIDGALREIFDFYARQHIQNNKGFEELQEGLKKIDIGEFNGFLRDFSINLPRLKTNDIYHRAGENK